MSTDKTIQAKQAAMEALQKINAVEGFDPSALAVEYADLNSSGGGDKRLRLPVMAQIGWFRLKYPEGRIAVSVVTGKDCFVATARVYPHYSAPVEQFLAEATASRGYLPDKPTVSPREWAQTAAVGIALRNAGFGLQFGAAGDGFDSPAVDELGSIMWSGTPGGASIEGGMPPPAASETPVQAPAPKRQEPALTPFERALKVSCPIAKYTGKTLGDVLQMDPKALNWVANKYTGDAEISAATKLICEEALKATAT